MIVDHLILGGGSAGCVLAARLSEDPRRRVMLVEAGRDVVPHDVPPDIRSRYPGRAYLDTDNIWAGLSAVMGARAGKRRRYEQAKILGGGSAINALMANRGAPSDYQEWVVMGADGWSFDECLPYFRKLETDRDCDGPLHGKDGPLLVRRIDAERMSPFVAAVGRTLASRGFASMPDQNGAWRDGFFAGTVAVDDDGHRMPVSTAYLTPLVRNRPNLEIFVRHQATGLLFEDRRIAGATIEAMDGTTRTILSRETIVCAGAIHSPALLMRSGIGPGHSLSRLGIAPVADLPGVGANLMEHPSIAVAAYLPGSARVRDLGEHHEQGVLRFSSGLDACPQGDMHAAILSRSGWHSLGQRMGSMFFWVNKSYSRGQVTLKSAHAHDEPDVDFRMLSDRRDLERLKLALKLGMETLASPSMDGFRDAVFPSSYTPRVASVATPGALNALQRGFLSALLDLSGPLRPALIHGVVTLGDSCRKLLADDAALTDFVEEHVGGTWHPSGTCRMGRADDPEAVTSPDGRVHGLAGLRVCDASLMPTIPCANTNIPTIMISERIADFVKAAT